MQNILRNFGVFLRSPSISALSHQCELNCFFSSSKRTFILPHQRYLLLVIYAFFNMNDVSWGTREVPKSAADLAAEAENQVWTLWLNRKILEQQPAFVCLSSSNLFWLKAKEVSKAASTKKEGGLLGYFQVNLGNFFFIICQLQLQSMAESKKKGNLEFSLGNIFSCLCFTTEDQVVEAAIDC